MVGQLTIKRPITTKGVVGASRDNNMKILHNVRHLTRLEIWQPRYSSAYTDTEERVALLAKYKVDYASPVIIVEFTKAKHLAGQRFCIDREKAKSFPVDSNGKIPCYSVPMSAFEPYETAEEVRDKAFGAFEGEL